MYNSEHNSIPTVWRELWGLGQNSCLALWKPLISEANQKKRLQFAGECKDWSSGAMDGGHGAWGVQVSSVPEWRRVQSKKRGRRSDAPIRSSADWTSLEGQCSSLWSLLFGSRFSNIRGQRMGSADHLNILTRLFHQWNFFSSPKARAYSKMTLSGLMGLKLYKSGSENTRYSFCAHGMAKPWLSPSKTQKNCWKN